MSLAQIEITEWPASRNLLDPYAPISISFPLNQDYKFTFTGFTVFEPGRGDAVDIEEPMALKPKHPSRIVEVSVGLDDTYEIPLWGRVCSKKNAYRTRKDRPGMFKDTALRRELDRLALQIPGELRGLELVHPAIEVFFEIPKPAGRQRPDAADRDGKLTTILDLLVAYKVLKDDSIRYCNGTVIVHPAKIGTQHYTKIVLRLRTDPDASG
jgi:hypothetical protein